MFDFLRTFSKLKDKVSAYTTDAEPQNYQALEALIFLCMHISRNRRIQDYCPMKI